MIRRIKVCMILVVAVAVFSGCRDTGSENTESGNTGENGTQNGGEVVAQLARDEFVKAIEFKNRGIAHL